MSEEKTAPVEETAPKAKPKKPSEKEKLRAELDQTKDLLLRTAAEYDNFKRRSEKEKADLSEFVKAATVKKLLGVADNVRRAQESDRSSPDYVKGLEMIVKQLTDALASIGLEEIEAEGQPFDPRFHEAVMHVEDETLGENVVVQVLQPGYRLGDTVLRPAMVKVAN